MPHSLGLALITTSGAFLWTDGRYFLQATQQLSDQWKLMKIGEDPTVENWIADVSHLYYSFIELTCWSLQFLKFHICYLLFL